MMQLDNVCICKSCRIFIKKSDFFKENRKLFFYRRNTEIKAMQKQTNKQKNIGVCKGESKIHSHSHLHGDNAVFSLGYIFPEEDVFTDIKAHPQRVLIGHVPLAWELRVESNFHDALL